MISKHAKRRGVVIPPSLYVVCGKRHTREVPFASIVDTYRQMDGQPFREFPLEGRNVVVHPMRGADAEAYERYTLDLGAAQEAWSAEPADSPEKRRLEDEVLKKRVRKLKVRGLLENIPEEITADISSMEINDMTKIGDIHVDNLEIVDNPNKVILQVVPTRGSAAASTEEETEEEA